MRPFVLHLILDFYYSLVKSQHDDDLRLLPSPFCRSSVLAGTLIVRLTKCRELIRATVAIKV